MTSVLVVDDSKALRMILRRSLSQLGYDVTEAGNGGEALEMLRSRPGDFQLALVDWNMPEMNGLELVTHLRLDDRFAELTIIMVTTETEFDRIESAIIAGANEYMMKPFTLEVLQDKLRLVGVVA